MLDVELFGLRAGWHHLVNLLFHLANTVLLFLLLDRMTGAQWRSAFVAALFALHPLHVESVAWIAERKDVLSTLFLLLTLLSYQRYVQAPSRSRYLGTLAAFALGLMAKPMLVTLPCVLLLLDYWPLDRFSSGRESRATGSDSRPAWRWLLIEKIPFFVLSLAVGVVALFTQQRTGAMATLESTPPGFRVGNALLAYVGYISKMVWPRDLAVIYPLPATITLVQISLAAAFLAGVSYATIRAARRHPYILVGWLWYLGTLVPVIGLVQVGNQALADRYSYIPLIGLFVAIAWGVPALVGPGRRRGTALHIAAGVAVFACAGLTWAQVGIWKDSVALFGHAVRAVPDNYVARQFLGSALAERGSFDEALVEYSEALRVSPGYTRAVVGKGRVLAKLGRRAEAIDHFERALEIDSDSVDAHLHMAEAFAGLGRVDDAIARYRYVLDLDPDNAAARVNLGAALAQRGDLDAAAVQYAQALLADPFDAGIHLNLGVVLGRLGRLDESLEHFRRALEIAPEYAEAHFSLGVALARQGKVDQSIEHFREALRLRPDFREASQALDAASRLRERRTAP
jgi:tetratricopeptide (TPR) repeat protein